MNYLQQSLKMHIRRYVNLIYDELDLVPIKTMLKKEPVPINTMWQYDIEVGNDYDLEAPLDKLIDIFSSKIETIVQLKKKFELNTLL